MAAKHHFVPQFYLRRFADERGAVWVWDKASDTVFKTTPENIGAEREFYRLDYLKEFGPSAPFEMEKQFSELESSASSIFDYWEIQSHASRTLDIPPLHREIIALFVAVQLFRTREARTQLTDFVRQIATLEAVTEILSDEKRLHADVVWNGEFINSVGEHLQSFIWILAANDSEVPFITSDHPVLLKSGDSREWIMGPRLYDPGIYVVYPLSPYAILYMYEPNHWGQLKPFDGTISPVEITKDTADHENSGQVGMSYRFVYSDRDDFAFARQFALDNPQIRDPYRPRYEVESELGQRLNDVTSEELVGIDRGLRESAEGKFATAEEVEATFAKYRKR